MFYLFRNLTCLCLCEDKTRLEEMKEDGDVILEHEQWLLNSELTVSDDGTKIVTSDITQNRDDERKFKLKTLDDEYKLKFKNISDSLGLATLEDNQDVIAELKAEYAALKTEYQTKLEAINNE